MTSLSPQESEFSNQLNARIEENLSNEQFGVTELADAMHMSRSNLLRKVKKATNLSVSQLINQARLQRAMELLRTTALNVSEVSHQVGFNSTSYFIKCFREYYGYPPGEASKHVTEEAAPIAAPPITGRNFNFWIAAALAAIAITGIWWSYKMWFGAGRETVEKSIVVLPFKNDSADSTNVYLINGLMEATLNNLQKIKELKVLSRTSAEKYRNSNKSIPEIAKELNATYFIEGSGQKIGDRIVLTIQLIEGANDRHLWSRQYRREVSDIFALQQEISKDIAQEIQVVITPEEKSRIEKIPTNNLAAYDSFLKGIDLLEKGGDENLRQAIVHYNDAIAKDNTFALAYACAAITYYYLDVYKAEMQYLDILGNYADKALLYDPKLSEGFRAKAMYYLLKKEYAQALPYLEKGLEYNPNSVHLIGLLADFYTFNLPNTGKYLEYALMGLRLGDGLGDSVEVSYLYLRLGNALIQTGFVDESLTYIDKSLEYNPNNRFSRYLRAFIMYAKTKDLRLTKNLLITELKKDTTRVDILQDVGKVCYYLKEYDSSYYYYKRFNYLRDLYKLDIYKHENFMIGKVYKKAGEIKKGEQLIESYRQYLDTDQTAYKDAGFAVYYDYIGNTTKALEHLKRFSEQDNIQYWLILFYNKDPDPGNMSKMKECKEIEQAIEDKFYANHKKLKLSLEEKGLL